MEPPAAVVLPSSAHAPAMARRFLREFGRDWPDQVLDAALLVVSEAVTNAVRHGRGRVQLCLDVDDRHIRIEVSDEDPRLPQRRVAPNDDLRDGGRGLHLLDALTTSWGTEPRADGPGKVVWMQLVRR